MDDLKITAHEKSYLAKCVEVERLRKEVLAARKLRDDINSYNVGMSLLVEDKFATVVTSYDKIREENEGHGL